MVEFLNGMKRSDMCGALNDKDVGKSVTIMGWVHRRRDLGGLIFIQVRDISGICQVVFDTNVCDSALLDKASELKLEYVVAVNGTVRMRTEGNINTNMATGSIEVCAMSFKILSVAETTPFSIGDEQTGETLRLTYRYLDLRRSSLQKQLLLRSKVCSIARNFLADNGFCEIETPMLGRSTPEGARDYLVPSRVHPGDYYALPQSPQLYKQLLMIGGMDRYYQISRCFRDEDLRANRQPEFTQIDLEMSFVDQEEEVMTIAEQLVKKVFAETIGYEFKENFLRLPYSEVMRRFGSDKPDLRYGMELCDISEAVANSGFVVFDNAIANNGAVYGICLKGKESALSRKDLDKLVEFVKTYRMKGLLWLGLSDNGTRCSFAKNVSEDTIHSLCTVLGIQNGDIAFIVADETEKAQTALGALRVHLADKFQLADCNDFKALWVTDFPLLEYSEEEGRYVAKHHPFTNPKDQDIPLLDTNPAAVRAKAYDIVINGDEMGGGSMRIYNKQLQEKVFSVLGFSQEDIVRRFGFFVGAFDYGTPPHGGLAFGLDRLIMTIGKTDNIREVIAFPKTQTASCMMTGAPASVEQKQLNELHLCQTNKMSE